MAPPQVTAAETHVSGGLFANETTPLDISISFCDDGVATEVGQSTHATNRRRRHTSSMARIRESLMYDELRGMTSLAVPVIGTYLLEFLPGLVSIVLVGHIKSDKTEEYIDATAMSVVFMNLCGLSIGVGLSSAMDTLCSQAFGADETHKMGVYLQTGALILATFSILIGVLFYYATDILLALGQPTEISKMTGEAVWVLGVGSPISLCV